MQVVDERRQNSSALRYRDPPEALEDLARITRCRRDQEIYRQEDPVESWYRVVSGVLRRFAVRPDGRRQIVDFLLPGDCFGFAGGDERHHFAVEAVTNGTTVTCYPRRRVERLAESNPEVAQAVRAMTSQAISRLEAQILILGRTRAPEKVGAFLLDMVVRWSHRERAATRVVLPMSRYDIADYLAVSVETVSRAMTRLKNRGAISLAGTRRVTIVDRDALDEGDENDYPAVPRSAGERVLDDRRRGIVDTTSSPGLWAGARGR